MGYRREGEKRTVFNNNSKNTENKFGTWLRQICGNHDDELLQMGLHVADIGTHSFRKGTATYLSGIPGGPSPVSIYLRAGWSLGNVQSRYILEGGGGDQLCGQVAAGLSLTDPSFADLPPHFNLRDEPPLSLAEWEAILPGYSSFYSDECRQAIPFLLASLVYHRAYLDSTLPITHPLRVSRVWTSNTLNRLSLKVHAGRNKNVITLLQATGIPHITVIVEELYKLTHEVDNIKEVLLQTIQELPSVLKEMIFANLTINGAIPVTRDQIEAMMATFGNRIIDEFKASLPTRLPTPNVVANTESTGDTPPRHWSWGNAFHPVPQDFRWPIK
jgi:hypothetical protein